MGDIADKTPRHKWGDPVTIVHGPNGCEQTDRTCVRCGLVKVTMHPPHGLPWRAWRHPKSTVQFPAEHTPPCGGGGRA